MIKFLLPSILLILTWNPNVYGKDFIVTTIIDKPFVSTVEKDNTVSYDGFMPHVLEDIAQRAGFRYKIKLTPDGKYGSRKDDGTWNGMIGKLLSGKADIAIGAIIPTAETSQVVDFTKPILATGITGIVKKPANGEGEFPFEELKDLIYEPGRYTFGAVRGSAVEKFFTESNDVVYREIGNILKSSPENLVESEEEGVARAMTGDYVFFLDALCADYILANDCQLMRFGGFMNQSPVTIAVRKGNGDLVQAINDAMLRMREDGSIQILWMDWFHRGPCNS